MWKEDVVELFIDADGNGTGYIELQVNPHNAHFDAWFETTRAKKADRAWSAGMTSAVVVRGTLDEKGDKDSGWDVEIAVPLASVRGTSTTMAVNLPPKVGDQWRLNVVRSDKPDEGGILAAAWNPLTYKDFHALDRMLDVAFGDAEGRAPIPEDEPAPPPRPPRSGPVSPATPESSGGVPSTESAGVPSVEESSGGVPESPTPGPVVRPQRRGPDPVDPGAP
jgi:hypothetical protein